MMSTTPHFRWRSPGRLVRVGLTVGAELAVAAATLFTVGPVKLGLASEASVPAGPITGLAGKCVDADRSSSDNGTPVQLYDCLANSAQSVSNPGDGTLRILGKCLDALDFGTADGTAVQLWDCHGGPNQQWVVNGAHDIVNPAANKCLDVRDNLSANKTRLQIWTCTGAANQKWVTTAALVRDKGEAPSGFVVSEAQFNEMFPDRNSFYTYSGLTAALSSYPGFATTGDDIVRKQEAAAFLANANHETSGLVDIIEDDFTAYTSYCDQSKPFGCPAGIDAYYGRGPIQLSWNYNYKAAGEALGLDLLNDPFLVQNDSSIAWKTALWYWSTQSGPGTMTPHDAMVNKAGFGQTIRSINGDLECDGKNPFAIDRRVDSYQRFTARLGVPAEGTLGC
ncbi:glycoside hydrolase family 19 protein [Streptomyces sp. NPDC093544]|uniref:glycoside hydrolase family 19 protein n=1 Tax=Streptomyces sp. NPDC093544 TaxID=3155200 RepID=UPI00342C3FD8